MKLDQAVEMLRAVLRRKHLSLSTEDNYVSWLARFSRFVVERCAADQSPESKLELFLTQLARQGVSASTQNQAFCALLFFYREVIKAQIVRSPLEAVAP